jgi:D-Tyr-tRNAtyr deacylase
MQKTLKRRTAISVLYKKYKKTRVSNKTGVFGAHMKITIENDGPCTILLDSEKQDIKRRKSD